MNLHIRSKYSFWSICLLLASCCALNTHAQTYLEVYGQNRLQYRKFDWKFFETAHFRVYHYDRAGKELARYVAEQAEADYELIHGRAKSLPKEKINIINYNSFDDYQQTNIGRQKDASQLRSFNSGSLQYLENKMVVWFTGVHTDLRAQISDGLSEIFFEKRIMSTTGKQKATTPGALNVPDWIEEGYTAYTAIGWTEAIDKDWKSTMEGYPNAKFYILAQKQPLLAGQAFWKYVRERYGKQEVASLMTAMRFHKSFSKTIKLTYKMKMLPFFDSALQYFQGAYLLDGSNKVTPNIDSAVVNVKIPTKTNTIIRDVKVSPRGADIAYTKWEDGVFQVCLKNTRGEQHEAVILEGGEKNYNQEPDPNYPLLTWSNTGYRMAILYKKGRQLRLRMYDAVKATATTYVVPNNRFDRALSMAIDEDNNGLILSAIRKSQTDLYHFTFKGSRMKNITNDSWNDIQPSLVTGGRRRGVVFLSNRPEANLNAPSKVNELPTGPMNAYFYDTKTQSSKLLQLTAAKEGELISRPIQYGPDNFSYLSNLNGTTNKYIVIFERDAQGKEFHYAVPEENYANSITAQQYSGAGNIVASVIKQSGGYVVYIKPFAMPNTNAQKIVQPALLVEHDTDKIGINPLYMLGKSKSLKYFANKKLQFGNLRVDEGDFFQTEFTGGSGNANKESVQEDKSTSDASTSDEVDSSFVKMKAQPYRTAFKANDISLSLDNTMLFNRYQPAANNGNSFANPSMGGLILLSMDDMLENYRITGGFKLPFANGGSTYFLQFENVKRRLDWGVSAFRNTYVRDYNIVFADSLGNPMFNSYGVGKNTTNILMGSASYPIDKMRSFRMQLGFRQDVLNFKAIDSITLMMPRDYKYWTTSRLEYVYDNTRLIETNIRNGSRYKFYGEYMYQFNNNGGGMYAIGFDVRAYQKLYKNLIWAFRISAATSGGKQKVLYFMGGVDNWINTQQETNAPVSTEVYGFQALANNLRGYKQGTRSGSSYAVTNNEIRMPILSTLLNRPISSKFLRSLQFVGFTDIGLAWDGFWPSEDKINKSITLTQYPVTTVINYPLGESISIGYGAGLRLELASYQVRLDAGWNRNSGPTPILYLSFGTDF